MMDPGFITQILLFEYTVDMEHGSILNGSLCEYLHQQWYAKLDWFLLINFSQLLKTLMTVGN